MIDRQRFSLKESINVKKLNTLRKVGAFAAWILFFVTTAATALAFFGTRFLMDNWAELSMDELVYHFKTTVEGTNPAMIRDGILRYGLPAVLVVAVVAGGFVALRDRKKARRIAALCVLITELCVILALKDELDSKIGLSDYVLMHVDSSGEDFVGDNYVDPADVKLKFPKKKRNLIYIYLESLEVTYSDRGNGGAFERNVIPELTRLAQKNEDFSGADEALNGGYSLPGTTWTVGAMFAQSAGIPLKIPLSGNGLSGEDSFFPNIVAIGDILEEQGYHNELLIGSEAVFGGRDIFYKTHGNYEIRDYTYAIRNGLIPKDYLEFWGFEDEKMFQFAKDDLLELSASGSPFNLTMLTVDTHFEDGYRCRLCRDEFGEQYADAFACSSRQLADFVEWVQQQSFYEDTTIILAGDHPTMDRDFCIDVPKDYPRKTYVCVINPGKNAAKADLSERREYDTFDLFPTTLAALDVKIPGERLGLGVNLYSKQKTLVEELGVEECSRQLIKPSAFMDEQSSLKISEENLRLVMEKLNVFKGTSQGGTRRLVIQGISSAFNYITVEKVEAEFTEVESGEKAVYEAVYVQPLANNANRYNHTVYITKDDPFFMNKGWSRFTVDIYLTVGDFKHYKIGSFDLGQ